MPRMFDILKKAVSRQALPRSVPAPWGLDEVINKDNIGDIEAAKKNYRLALEVADKLTHNFLNHSQPAEIDKDTERICEIVDLLSNQLILGNSLLEIIAYQYDPQEALPRHALNVCILSLALGLELRFNKSELHILAKAALLHDLGMFSVKEIIDQPRQLCPDELEKIRQHVNLDSEISRALELACGYPITEIIQQHHERINSQGYPLGLEGPGINNYAKIIALADTYEAMTHQRSFRQALPPHHAVKEITSSLKLFFEQALIKALVKKISVYPIGSFTVLNTRETAKVLSAHPDSPLRPLVLIVLDSFGKQLLCPKVLDLSKNSSVYIKGPFAAEQDARFLGKDSF